MKLFVLAARASAAAALTARVCAKPSFFVGDARANVVYHPSPVSHHLPSSARPLRSSPASAYSPRPPWLSSQSDRKISRAVSTQAPTDASLARLDAVYKFTTSPSRSSPPNVPAGNEYQVEVTNGKDNKTRARSSHGRA
ncbi:hypothetical protein B0H14DRAFT_2617782 [Mycena olivaceomarginata]|nr:hypothetical protein B0H14DRAFT_2617782 [Mycena olivaceomarginata]